MSPSANTQAPSSTSNAVAGQRWSAALMNNYGTPAIELVSGAGAEVTDADGTRYLDLLGGIAVNALGHGHAAVVQAVTEQVSRLGHVSNLYSHPNVLELAERLQDISGAGSTGRVLFTNSGTEANEAAFKIARLTGRRRIVAATKGFHGRTMGSLALTGQPSKQEPFAPMPAGVEFVDFGDTAALAAAVAGADGDPAAAVFLEPIQGEGGVVVPPDGYLAAAREITAAAGTLLVLDEIQTGIGRTGSWFNYQRVGISPDVVTVAKGLGGGLPIGALIAFGETASLLTPGLHGSTFAGNPIAAAAALAVLNTIESQGLLAHVDQMGKHLMDAVTDLAHPLIQQVRGSGLLVGIVLSQPLSAAVVTQAARAGFLLNGPTPDVLRLAPPLIVSTEQVDRFVAALPQILDSAAAS